jgi:hypothetical protein
MIEFSGYGGAWISETAFLWLPLLVFGWKKTFFPLVRQYNAKLFTYVLYSKTAGKSPEFQRQGLKNGIIVLGLYFLQIVVFLSLFRVFPNVKVLNFEVWTPLYLILAFSPILMWRYCIRYTTNTKR